MNNVNYFIVNGKSYFTGTVFIVNYYGKQIEATFVCYNVDTKRYIYIIKNGKGNSCRCRVTEKDFYDNLVTITDKVNKNVHVPIEKKMKDSQIDGLFLGWMWYIFLMAISVIFKDVIGLWIVISVVFFSWRHGKIKKEGTYIEW